MSRKYVGKYIVCLNCAQYVRLRNKHLYDKEQKAFRCQSCWDLYMDNDYLKKGIKSGKDTKDSSS